MPIGRHLPLPLTMNETVPTTKALNERNIKSSAYISSINYVVSIPWKKCSIKNRNHSITKNLKWLNHFLQRTYVQQGSSNARLRAIRGSRNLLVASPHSGQCLFNTQRSCGGSVRNWHKRHLEQMPRHDDSQQLSIESFRQKLRSNENRTP